MHPGCVYFFNVPKTKDFVAINEVCVCDCLFVSGLTESVVAAALSRVGQRVLHVDR